MITIILTIQSLDGVRQTAITQDRLAIGRSESADISIDDAGLSHMHSSIHRQDDRIWVLDENSTNGSYVNGKPVPGCGLPLADGDQISIGHYTTIFVKVVRPNSSIVTDQSKRTFIKPPLAMIVPFIAIIAVLAAATALKPGAISKSATDQSRITKSYEKTEVDPVADDQSNDEQVDSSNTRPDEVINTTEADADSNSQIEQRATGRKLYIHLTEEEQNEFIYSQARNISRMMSNREYVFTDDVLPYIKRYVDVYARRVNNRSTSIWGEDLNFLFSRARRLAPDIIREFNARGVPKVVGLYIPMIESEYRQCLTSPVGAKGLYQFMPETARGYGVDPGDRCDVKKMAPAAARYLKDRIAEFGSDSMSVALGIAGYNRSPDSVRRDLNDVLNSRNKERSFWTLISNSDKLDRFFQNENIKYVPKFFAAAIVGETPWAFGLEMNPLSTYAGPTFSERGSQF